MKKLFPKAFTGFLLACLFSASALAQTRIATVDVSTLWTKYWKRSQGDAAVKAQMADKRKQFDDMVANYNKLQDEYKKLLDAANDQAVSPEERARRKKDADAKQKQISDTQDTLRLFKSQFQAAMEEQMTRMRQSILNEIFSVVKAKAAAGNYSLVIDSSALSSNQTPIVLYMNDKENDLTDAALKQLNATAPPGALPTTGATPQKPDPKQSQQP
jgi:outer membrane protein